MVPTVATTGVSMRVDGNQSRRWARFVRSLATVMALVAASVLLASVPVGSTNGVAACRFADARSGVIVSWGSLSIDADGFVIERSDDGGETFVERGRGSDGSWTDTDVGALVPDAEAADEAPDLAQVSSTRQYRVVMTDGDEVLTTVRCRWDRGNTGRFECSVRADGDGYLVEWKGGPTGAGLGYVIERRDAGDVGGAFEWRAEQIDQKLVDEGSVWPPIYRVTALFSGVDAVSVRCEPEIRLADGAVVQRVAAAAFVCPAPGSTFVDTFGADRDGGARRHRGVDMFAPVGSPVVAPEDGELVLFWNELGGKSFGLYGDSGTFYYGAHLDSFVGEDRRVLAGELVGTIGNTGNARTTPPHLHFQVHPDGRRTTAVNPTEATALACS